MSDEDPKSLLVLCDDTIREILSYMPVKSRVKHSRTSRVIRFIVHESLLGVHSLHDEKWFASPHIESRIHTLSKLKNLRSLPAVTEGITNAVMAKIVSVMATNCHYVQRIENWNLKYVVLFVKQLIANGVPVRLKVLNKFNGTSDGDMKFLIEKTKVMLSVSVYEMPEIQETGCMHRVVEVRDIRKHHNELPFEQMASVKKLSGSRFMGDYGEFAKRVFQSLPQLTDLNMRPSPTNTSGNRLLQTLMQAEQEFEGMEIVQRLPADESEDLDMDLLKRLLEKRGPKLKKLAFHIRVRDPTSEEMMQLLQLISATCTRLKTFSFSYGKPLSSLLTFWYNARTFDLIKTSNDVSLHAVLSLVHGVRTVVVDYDCLTGGRIPRKMMRELQEFADSKKKYCIHVVTGLEYSFREKQTFIRMHHNLRLYRDDYY